MDILLIWHNDFRFIEEELKNSLPIGQNAIFECISNETHFNDYLKKNLIPDHIFILVELYWEKRDFHGYDIALQIMQQLQVKDKAPSIQFISLLFTCEELYEVTSGMQNCFVKSFPLYSVSDKLEFKFNSCSVRKWNYLRKFALTFAGELRIIKHDLSFKSIEDILFDLDKQRYICGDTINNKVALLKDVLKGHIEPSTKEKLHYELKEILEKRIEELEEIKDEQKHIKRDYKIIIVEDDELWKTRLHETFSIYFTEVMSFRRGEDAISYLENQGKFSDAILVDLNLRDGQFNQEVLGIDILDYIQENCPHLAARVITGFSDAGIDILFPDEKPKILYKRNFSTVDDAYCDDIVNDIRKSYPFLKLRGPKSAIWSPEKGDLLRYYYMLKHNIRKKIWEEVFLLIDDFQDDREFFRPATQSDYVNILIQKGKEYEIRKDLVTILLHRQFWLNKFYKNDDYSLIDNSQFTSKAENEIYKIRISENNNYRTYARFLGFSTKRQKDKKDSKNEACEYFYYFKFNQLFREEAEALKGKVDFINDDLNNSFLADSYYDLHGCIYKEGKYPSNINEVFELFNLIKTLDLSESKKNEINNICTEFISKSKAEFDVLPKKLCKLISNLFQ